jgi:AcrR family transcriptional regulator
MRDLIIKKAIDLLFDDGLRFSVDDIASQLKISKKTIYKAFDTKEDLAIAVYSKVYDDIFYEIASIGHESDYLIFDFLHVYSKALFITSDFVLNRYSLNDRIRNFAKTKMSYLWNEIAGTFCKIGFDKECRNLSFKMIIDDFLTKTYKSKDKDILLNSFIEIIFGR